MNYGKDRSIFCCTGSRENYFRTLDFGSKIIIINYPNYVRICFSYFTKVCTIQNTQYSVERGGAGFRVFFHDICTSVNFFLFVLLIL